MGIRIHGPAVWDQWVLLADEARRWSENPASQAHYALSVCDVIYTPATGGEALKKGSQKRLTTTGKVLYTIAVKGVHDGRGVTRVLQSILATFGGVLFSNALSV